LIHFYKRLTMVTKVTEDVFGSFEESEVKRFTLEDGAVSLQVINYGATITSIKVHGVDVVLGFDDMDGYTSKSAKNPYMGAVVGRVANRIANGSFNLDGKTYTLAKNNGPNALHGGIKGLDKVMWKASIDKEGAVIFSYLSKDNDEGYPGDVIYNAKYSLKEGGVRLDFKAMTTSATPINLANHVYFNLAGHDAGAEGLYDHVMRMCCDKYTPVSDKLIPTGEIAQVGNTVFDLRFKTRLGDVLPNCPGGDNNGFDHNFVVSGERDINLVCRVSNPKTGIWLECFTDQPGCQFYTGNFIPADDSLKGKGGAIYRKHSGFCLETQKFPDSVNQTNFPSSVMRPGEIYNHTVIYQFGKN